jgi:hypothetical protein
LDCWIRDNRTDKLSRRAKTWTVYLLGYYLPIQSDVDVALIKVAMMPIIKDRLLTL